MRVTNKDLIKLVEISPNIESSKDAGRVVNKPLTAEPTVAFLSSDAIEPRGLARNSKDRKIFRRLQALRILLGTLLVLFAAQTIDFGLSATGLAIATAIGAIAAGIGLNAGKSLTRVLIWHGLVFCLLWALFQVANFFVTAPSSASAEFDFLIPRYADDVFLLLLFYSVALLSSWYFWTRTSSVTVEGLLCSAAFVWLLSGHRNYHVDAPKQISSLTWKFEPLQKLHLEPQHLLLTLGAAFLVILALYFILAANRPLFGRAAQIKSYGPTQKLLAILCPLLVLISLYSYARYLNSQYSQELTRVSNGVGTKQTDEGKSNLGFHSAISPTKQPSALVRLEGDYPNNPWTPMLYLREGALSTYNGIELVKASGIFDTDVPAVSLGQPYASAKTQMEANREQVVQSVYLMTEHTSPFAIDTPQRIVPIKNPYPERFISAYQALSFAPTKPLKDLMGQPVGGGSWDAATWDHYLRAPGSTEKSIAPQKLFDFSHLPTLALAVPDSIIGESLIGIFQLYQEQKTAVDQLFSLDAISASEQPVLDLNGEDLRYRAFAEKLVGGVSDPVLQAALLVQHLSETSIYTRQPGHQVSERGDPVAAYLFSEKKRGYCVHFAHAAVYLMRLLGIPARIGTGYLTDLTYAKDGHILLHLGDRHAWAEVYISGHGWMVFDVTPSQAENEQAIIPDENLLDDLMSKLDPAEKLLEPLPLDPEQDAGESILAKVAGRKTIITAIIVILLALLLVKLWLRYGYKFVSSERRRVRLAYASFASLMTDSGLARYQGETRREYCNRLQLTKGIDAAAITLFNQQNIYSKTASKADLPQLEQALQQVKSTYDNKETKFKRMISFFSPLSLTRIGSW